jgi:heavy metal sensor kinase
VLQFRRLPFRARLTTWYALVLAAVLLLFAAGSACVLYFQLLNQMSHFAIQDVETIEGLLFIAPDGRLSLHEDYHNHPQSRLLLERLLEIRSPDGTLLYRNDRLGNDELGGKPFAGEGVEGFSERSGRLKDGGRILLVSRYYRMHGGPVMVIRLGYRQDAIWSRMKEFLAASLVALPFFLAIAAVFGYQLARRALYPLGQMAQRAEQITAERLNQRLPVEHPGDELGHLARVFNNVLDRLELSFEQLRRFTSDASHELRTPLAAIRSVGEVGLQNSQTAAGYKDTIGSMLEEVGRLTKLVESLLAISRSDAGQVQLNLTVFSPLDLVKEVAAFFEVLTKEREQKLLISGDADLHVKGDRLLLRQAVINVLHNAVKYSPVGGAISVSVTSLTSSSVIVKIADSGPGISAEHQAKIFERFYRIDAGRTRDTGGTGLGLSIAQWAVHAQGGEIRVESSDEGAAFVMELPAFLKSS